VAAENSLQAIAGAVNNKKLELDAATGANEQVYATNRQGQTTLMTKGDAIGQGFGYTKVGSPRPAIRPRRLGTSSRGFFLALQVSLARG
jgi:hypothetical protein